ncbi:MAG: acylphosphatase [Hyphomicrobiales bacterium]|nr:acylphosphatase [Hyphomicrobiales bacterium]
MPHYTIHIRIEGRVQGVGYRAWTVAKARELGLSGWVRNRRDGWVEALFSGPTAHVQKMLDSCRDGPPAARVSAVQTTEEVPALEIEGFRSLPTL